MDFRTASVTVAADGKATATATASNSTGSVLLKGITGLVSPFSDNNDLKLVTEREAGVRQLVTGAFAFLGGDLFGNARGAQGKKPLIKFMAG